MSSGDFTNQPIVIDNGSGLIKAGFAGDHVPKCHFPNFVGRPKWNKVMATGLEGDCFIGDRAQDYRGLMSLRYPIESGLITDWSDMEMIWRSIYTKDQLNARPDEHPVLLTEAPNCPRRQREKAAEIFFETLNVPAMHFALQAVMSLYATGRTTGLVLDAGDGVVHVVPVFEGFSVSHGVACSPVAGRNVTRYLRSLLQKEGYDFSTSAELEVVREIKEHACYVAADPLLEDATAGIVGRGGGGGSASSASASKGGKQYVYKLPDGTSIALGASRFRAPELLFKPHHFGYEAPGVCDLLLSSVNRVDLDTRKTFFGNIVLSGGSTLFPGFGDRLLHDLKSELPSGVKIRITAPQERMYSCWIGGSILAALGTWRKMWITKAEYSEDGVKAVHRKCFG